MAIGNFDGVHLGHAAVIARAAARGEEIGGHAVLTFEPHPREVIAPDRAPARLTPLGAKLRRLRALGVRDVFVLPFDHRLRAMSAESFARDVLHEALGVRHAVAGENFRFGNRRAGDMAMLAGIGRGLGFGVEALVPVEAGGAPVSSSRIREALLAGDVSLAARLLGCPHAVAGPVVLGDQRGRTIGFPTANVRPLGRRLALPAAGVYAVTATLHEAEGVEGAAQPAVANLGWRPTFDGQDLRLEVHLLDFQGDLYGRRLEVAFLERLRGEARFDGLEALKRQIAADVEAARAVHELDG